jgi:FkbM family methyltransferase
VKHACLREVHRGDTVLDIGANYGYFTLLLSDLVGPSGRVHAFEPVPTTWQRLNDTVRSSALFTNVTLHRAAVSASDGMATIHLPGEDSGQASLRRQDSGSWEHHSQVETFTVPTVALDTHESTARPIAFIKCDVEGAELPALQGMVRSLTRWQPLLLLEVCGAWTRSFGYKPADVFRFLRAHGYDRFVEVGPVPRLVEEGSLPDDASFDVLCSGPRSSRGSRHP